MFLKSFVYRTVPRVALLALLTGALLAADASAQSRRRTEPAPPPEPIPAISDEAAKCSFAYHDALAALNSSTITKLVTFDQLAPVTEPSVSGKWLLWTKTGKGVQKPAPERVCVERVIKSGRERCIRFETKPVDPKVVAMTSVPPSAEELPVLRALDGYVTDKGAPLEFGSNGRQYAVLQRVASEIGAYSSQPRHPALCNGVPEMMEFKLEKLAGLRKRFDDVNALASKAAALARKRVIAAGDIRFAEATKAAAAASAASTAAVPTAAQPANAEAGAAAPMPAVGAPPVSLPVPAPAKTLPPGAEGDPAALLAALLDGMIPAEQGAAVARLPSVTAMLQQARDLVAKEDAPGFTPAARSAAGAALRMIEAANYAKLHAARMKTFETLFFGSIQRILDVHKGNCTCGG